MRKVKQPERTPLTFKQYLSQYDNATLQGAITGLNDSIAWGILRAFIKENQRSFEIAALDLVGHTGKAQEAAKSSGYAQACEDIADKFMQELVKTVAGIDGFIEGPKREEI